MQKENLILVVIGFADTVALNLYMSQRLLAQHVSTGFEQHWHRRPTAYATKRWKAKSPRLFTNLDLQIPLNCVIIKEKYHETFKNTAF